MKENYEVLDVFVDLFFDVGVFVVIFSFFGFGLGKMIKNRLEIFVIGNKW